MPTEQPRIVIVQHQDVVPLDLLTQPLAGADLVHVRADREPLPPLADVDAVLVLGGTMSVGDDESAPWLPAVKDYLREAVAAEVTTLGICLGAQLLAVALGGEVEPQAPAGPERGLVELRMRPDAGDDALLGPVVTALGRDVLAPSSHEDAISTLPDGAVWLASSRQYPFQGFRIGSAWGVQFHPEASEATLQTWQALDLGADNTEAAQRDLAERYAAGAKELNELAAVVGSTFLDLARERVNV